MFELNVVSIVIQARDLCHNLTQDEKRGSLELVLLEYGWLNATSMGTGFRSI